MGSDLLWTLVDVIIFSAAVIVAFPMALLAIATVSFSLVALFMWFRVHLGQAVERYSADLQRRNKLKENKDKQAAWPPVQ